MTHKTKHATVITSINSLDPGTGSCYFRNKKNLFQMHLWSPLYQEIVVVFLKFLLMVGKTTVVGGDGLLASDSTEQAIHWLSSNILVMSHDYHGIINHWQILKLFVQPFVQAYIHSSKKTSKLHATGPLWGESTGDQWIPFTKGQ